MARYQVSYTYKKDEKSGGTMTSLTVSADTEATAIQVVRDRHPGHIVLIKGSKKLS